VAALTETASDGRQSPIPTPIYRSTDGGATWSQATTIGVNGQVLSRVEFVGGDFIVTGRQGLWAQSSDGASWTVEDLSQQQTRPRPDTFVDVAVGPKFWLATDEIARAFYVSYDQGTTWEGRGDSVTVRLLAWKDLFLAVGGTIRYSYDASQPSLWKPALHPEYAVPGIWGGSSIAYNGVP
jgi:photosystem II stability/assembly factor-like uncharacterized protein